MIDIGVKSAWDRACDSLRGDMGGTSYKTWIEPLKLLDHRGNLLVAETQNQVSKSTIQRMYQPLLLNAMNTLLERDFTLKLIMPGEESPAQETGLSNGASLNPHYTFETFVVGNYNRFAHAASLAVAEGPSDAYNPLFLYGGVGLGKTHLMHAIGNFIQERSPQLKILYTTSENFTNELIAAIVGKTNQQFREKLRTVDILLIDDIQFIVDKTSTQEELFHTFNELHSAGKQVIISSDKPPKEIPRLEERLRSRFEWGLIADIQKPDYENRIAILKKKAELESLNIDMDVLAYIAERVDTNIRELEGSLTCVVAYASLNGRDITLQLADEALRKTLTPKTPRKISPEDVINAVSRFYGVKIEQMTSQRRSHDILVPRQMAMYLMREMLGTTFPMIGQYFGGRDHSTVMSAYDKIKDNISADSQLKATVDDLEQLIRGR